MRLGSIANNFEEQFFDFFTNIKEWIIDIVLKFYGDLVDILGKTPTDVLLMAIGFILIALILMKIINR